LAFDTPCIEGVAETDKLKHTRILARQYDILQRIWTAVGKKYKGWGLGPVCERTLGIGKTGTGEHAPKLFKEGRFAELHDYNINDVHLTRMLFNHIVDEGKVVGPENEEVKLWTDKRMTYC
jgi:hypothetical protein